MPQPRAAPAGRRKRVDLRAQPDLGLLDAPLTNSVPTTAAEFTLRRTVEAHRLWRPQAEGCHDRATLARQLGN